MIQGGKQNKVDPVLKVQIFLPISGLLRPTIYQINGNLMRFLINFADLRQLY